jgi:hypothetical protein
MGEQLFWISRANIQKSLQKSRAARAKEDTRPAKHQELAFLATQELKMLPI